MTPSAFRSASAVLSASRCTHRSATPRYSSPNELFQVWAAFTTTRYFVIRSAFQARSKNAAVSRDYGRGTLDQFASGLEFCEKHFLLRRRATYSFRVSWETSRRHFLGTRTE